MIEFFNNKQYFSYIHDKNCLTIKQHIMKYKRWHRGGPIGGNLKSHKKKGT
jgi:hypothetical protein